MSNDYRLILLSAAALIVFLFLSITILVIATGRVDEANRDKLIQIGSNSLGCIKYKYNSDMFWKCPPELSINSIEEQRCQSSGKGLSCTTEVLPAIK